MITPDQREKRRSFIGSSDVAAICGCDGYRNIYDLWLDKTGRLDADKDSEPAEIGRYLERAILDMFEQRMDVALERDLWLERHDDGFPACANLDGAIGKYIRPNDFFAESTGFQVEAVVEAKSTGLRERWGDSIDDIPLNVLCQINWQLYVSGARIGYVPALFPGYKHFDFQVYQIERNDTLIREMVARACEFWNVNVLQDREPEGVTPHMDALKRRRRQAESTRELGEDGLIARDRLELWKSEKKKAEREIETAQAELLTLLGDDESGTLPDGSILTYFLQNGAKSCDFDSLERELIASNVGYLYGKLVKSSRFRVLRVKKVK